MSSQIGRYEIIRELGRGAMGAVYQARDPQIDRAVAIKTILTANLTAEALDEYKQRFYREARAAGKMSHPGIVTIYDIAEDETGQPFLVMEYVEGVTLESMLRPGTGAERLPLEKSLEIARQVAEALDFAHRRGVVHRDIKPANILITPDGLAKIADFGIAKLSGAQLTQTGHLLGTPAYMSPEQFSGAAVDARTDLFSLGAMLYWMCTGEKPFGGDTLTAVSFKVVYSEPIPASQLNPAVPRDLDTVLARCLAKNPADRYATGHDVANDLDAIRTGRPITAKSVAQPTAEKTTVTVRAAPVPAGVAQTVMVRPQPETTEALIPPRAPEPTVLLHPPSPARGVLDRLRARTKLVAGAAVGLAVLLLVGNWLWPVSPQETPRPESGESTEANPSPPRVFHRPAPKPVPMSTLRIDCQHNFRTASLEIISDGKTLYKATLRGEVQDIGVMKIAQGSLRASVAIPAGQRVLRVHVSSPRESYEGNEEIGGSFAEGGARTLGIEFGKGSAFGVVERRLTLHWK